MQQKIDDGEFEVLTATTTFADTLAPIKNLLEIVNINNAEHAKNAGWQIFLAKNNFGITDHYSDEQQIAIKPANPLDTNERRANFEGSAEPPRRRERHIRKRRVGA